MGRYPLRRGFDGSVSQSWADGDIGWNGYIAPEKLPRLIDPPKGFITTANNRTVGSDYPFVLAHNQANGYRAYRIAQRLGEMEKLDEQDLFNIQLDTRSEFFDFYRKLALEIMGGESRLDPELEEARRVIEAWNGHMDADSQGIGLLWLWRENLAAAAFAPVVARCRQVEPGFSYTWRKMETPLRTLLTQRIPLTLPTTQYRDWRDLLLKTLTESTSELKRRQGVATLEGLTWGKINQVHIRHPFSKSMPFLSPLLDMAERENSGCAGFCVRIAGNGHGATERMVISPGHPGQGILHMPGGQSGHPMSSHYRDQQPAWQEGFALPFLPGESKHTLSFISAH
jgi:penicillin amidase